MMPDETNIVDHPGLDEDWAKKNFLAKTHDDVRAMFRADKNLCYTEDFTYLSDLAVRYYLPVAIEYASSTDSAGDYLFIGGIATSLACQLEHNRFSDETKRIAQEFAKLVLSDLAKYDFDRHEDDFWINSLEYICGQTHGPRS
ncbi:MAG: hypothetical protein AAF802_30680 [Planctomycetota bacterium]